jgi:hypothetical protein
VLREGGGPSLERSDGEAAVSHQLNQSSAKRTRRNVAPAHHSRHPHISSPKCVEIVRIDFRLVDAFGGGDEAGGGRDLYLSSSLHKHPRHPSKQQTPENRESACNA